MIFSTHCNHESLHFVGPPRQNLHLLRRCPCPQCTERNRPSKCVIDFRSVLRPASSFIFNMALALLKSYRSANDSFTVQYILT